MITSFKKPAQFLDNNLDGDTVTRSFSIDQYKLLEKFKKLAISFYRPWTRTHKCTFSFGLF